MSKKPRKTVEDPPYRITKPSEDRRFITTDGKAHENYPDAFQHEARLSLTNLLEQHLGGMNTRRGEEVVEAVQEMLANRKIAVFLAVLIAHLHDVAVHELEGVHP